MQFPASGGATWANAHYIEMNGVDEQISSDRLASAILADSEDFSVSVWTKWLGDDGAGASMIRTSHGNTIGGWGMFVQNYTRYYCSVRDANYLSHNILVYPVLTGDHSLNDGNWHQCAFTWKDGGGAFALTAYWDGADAEALGTRGTESAMNVVHPTSPICVGARASEADPPVYSNFRNGWWSMATVWKNKVLSAPEIAALYNSGAGLDPTANSGDYQSAAEVVLAWGMGDATGDTTEAATGIKSFVGEETGTAANMTDAVNIKEF